MPRGQPGVASERMVAAPAWLLPLLMMGLGALAGPALAAAPSDADTLARCRTLADPAQRLACYDALPAVAPAPAVGPAADAVPVRTDPAPAPAPTVAATEPTLTSFWELDRAHKRGVFRALTYRPSFFLPLHHSGSINQAPDTPSPGRTVDDDYRRVGSKLQLSLRTKLVQSLLLPDADLWFGYTQVSLWQLWSREQSSPFRSTDHEPELIYVVPLPQRPGLQPRDWRLPMLQFGLTHQSNGQSLPASRSWNRVWMAATAEQPGSGLMLSAKVWHRLREDAEDDDNPDLTHFRGHGELQASWAGPRALTSLSWRTSLRKPGGRGALQLDWSYPVQSERRDGLRWYVQVFSGYGETLLDYNFRQTSIGLGVTLFSF